MQCLAKLFIQQLNTQPLCIKLLNGYSIKVYENNRQPVQFFIGNIEVTEQTFSGRLQHEPAFKAGRMKATVCAKGSV